MTDVLEKGKVHFLVWPARGEEEVTSAMDVQRFFMVLEPEGSQTHRRVVVGQKKLPEAEGEQERYWGFVDRVAQADEADALFRRGEDAQLQGPPAHVAGRGRYVLAQHEDHTDFAYSLESPDEPDREQQALHIEARASYVVAVKNPKAGAPEGAGLDREERAEFPEELREKFGDKRWVDANPPAFLDHEGAEFVLITRDEAAPDAVREALGGGA